ncbi:ATP-dependent zinc metalloprotease FTSH 4 [Colletotrichum sidae]|uniref:ATP-dependent zinc metalloprotease FTSH 4 n=1 Tax=Colletotrichum sidae TaxID=1347389 RepID=A0A4R8TF84_9PEZI|nr:ATP-dependent zinc metalloprotease FTSH 4 [Colletotrichum sidae]
MRWIDSKQLKESQSPYYRDKKLLSLLVDPKTTETRRTDLAIDCEMEQEIREIASYHRDTCKSTKPYGLLGRADTGGALVRALCHTTRPREQVLGRRPKAIQGLFNLSKLLSPSIIFIDEAEAMFPAREHLQHQHVLAGLNQLLHEMDGLSRSNETPFDLIATNLPGRLDPAVLRRVPTVLKEEILHPEVNISQLALMTPGLTGSDIRALGAQTAIIYDSFVKYGEHEGKRLLTVDMFARALGSITPTATKEALSSISAFSKDNHPVGLEYMRECDAENLRIEKTSATETANSHKSQHQEWRLDTVGKGKQPTTGKFQSVLRY